MEEGGQMPVVLSIKKKRKRNSRHKNNENISANTKSASKFKKDFRKKKKEKMKENLPHRTDITSEVFAFEEISNNTEASSLILDLVSCFTSNSTLSQKELDVLNKKLYDRTVSVILHVLNRCVEKMVNKLLSTDFFNSLLMKNKTVGKKSVHCQTNITYENLKD